MNKVIFQVEIEANYASRKNILDKNFIQYCIDSVRDYALKHGYDYKLITRSHPKNFNSIAATHYDWIYYLEDFLKYDEIVYIDTDILCTYNETPFPSLDSYDVLRSPQVPGRKICYYEEDKSDTGMFFNPGLIIMSRSFAKKLNEWFRKVDCLSLRNSEIITVDGIPHFGNMTAIALFCIENENIKHGMIEWQWHLTNSSKFNLEENIKFVHFNGKNKYKRYLNDVKFYMSKMG